MRQQLQAVWSSIRNGIAGAIVTSVNDTGGAKTVNITTGSEVNRADVEVADPWGFSAVPPMDGTITVTLRYGDDPANIFALPLSNPSCRFGGLLTGESVLYGQDGSRVHIRQGGIVDIWGGTQVNLHTKGCTINAPEGCTVNGNATVNGNVTVTGDFTGG